MRPVGLLVVWLAGCHGNDGLSADAVAITMSEPSGGINCGSASPASYVIFEPDPLTIGVGEDFYFINDSTGTWSIEGATDQVVWVNLGPGDVSTGLYSKVAQTLEYRIYLCNADAQQSGSEPAEADGLGSIVVTDE